MNITEALALLDHENDDHWTTEGLPRMDAIVDLTGDASIKRKDVTDAAPEFNRESAAAVAEELDEDVDETVEEEEERELDEDETEEEEPEDELVESDDDASEEHEQEEEAALGEGVSIFELETRVVLNSYDYCLQGLKEIELLITSKVREKEAIQEELEQLNAKNEMLKRAIILHEREGAGGGKDTSVQDYLRRSAESRAEKAQRALKFIESGTTAKDVAAQLTTKSKLDQAMGRRKPAPGSVRPATRTLIGN